MIDFLKITDPIGDPDRMWKLDHSRRTFRRRPATTDERARLPRTPVGDAGVWAIVPFRRGEPHGALICELPLDELPDTDAILSDLLGHLIGKDYVRELVEANRRLAR
jgi:hypothetical protein